jgi:glutathione S-transferase
MPAQEDPPVIVIYGVSQSRAMRSLWAAEEIGIEYEHVPVHFADETKTPEYLAINPNGRIPTLVDGDLVLFESMAINLYLARTYDGGLKLKTEADEARAVQWSFWGMTELEPHLLKMLLNRVLLPEDQRNASEAEAGAADLQAPLGVLDGALAGRSYLLGDSFTIADLNVASVLSWAIFVGLDLSSFARVKAWFDACLGRPAVARARGSSG